MSAKELEEWYDQKTRNAASEFLFKIANIPNHISQNIEKHSRSTQYDYIRRIHPDWTENQVLNFIARYTGNPLSQDRGHDGSWIKAFFMFGDPAVQGTTRDLEWMFSKENTPYEWASVILNPLIMGAGAAFIGKNVFDWFAESSQEYSAIPKYDKDNYFCIVLGETDENGDYYYFRMPLNRTIKPFYLIGRKIMESAIDVWRGDKKEEWEKDDFVESIRETVLYFDDYTPGVTPFAAEALKYMQFAVGQNPVDLHNGGYKLPYKLNEYGNMGDKMTYLAKDSFNQFAGSAFYRFPRFENETTENNDAYSTAQKIPVVSPLIQRYIRKANLYDQQQREIERQERKLDKHIKKEIYQIQK